MAYKNIHAGIQRHLESKPFYRKFSITRDSEFKEANNVYTQVVNAHNAGLNLDLT